MIISAQKIQEWRVANPGTRLTEKRLLEILGLETLRYASLRGWAEHEKNCHECKGDQS